jgi:polyisoprenoid-binding protein YceI
MSAGMSFSADSTRFTIDPQQSEARFAIDELLLGEPKTVTAVSSGVTGEIGVDFETPANTAVGPIQVDTRQFLTDNDFRNRAIRSRILLSDAYPTVTFTPTAVNGLPESIPWGEAVQFQITGDLTITGHTEPVTFDVTVLPVSESRLEGQAAATILRQDFDLVVPSATGVAGVGEEVTLELSFVAAPQE